jgi:hypothetical protein
MFFHFPLSPLPRLLRSETMIKCVSIDKEKRKTDYEWVTTEKTCSKLKVIIFMKWNFGFFAFIYISALLSLKVLKTTGNQHPSRLSLTHYFPCYERQITMNERKKKNFLYIWLRCETRNVSFCFPFVWSFISCDILGDVVETNWKGWWATRKWKVLVQNYSNQITEKKESKVSQWGKHKEGEGGERKREKVKRVVGFPGKTLREIVKIHLIHFKNFKFLYTNRSKIALNHFRQHIIW